MSVTGLLLELLFCFFLDLIFPSAWRAEAPPRFEVGERFEQRVNGVPFQQGWIAAVNGQRDHEIITVEWDDGTRMTGQPAHVLRSAKRIHPLAPRLHRSAPP